MLSRFRLLILVLFLVSLTACAAPPAPSSTSVPVATPVASVATSVPVATTSVPIPTLTNTPPSTAAAGTPTSAPTAASGAAATGGQVPNACSDLVKLVGSYMGGVATTKSLGSPQHLSCEFANSNASTIIVVNIGVGGTVANFDALRTSSGKNGRTVTTISGLGASAFSVSKNGVPAGVSVLTDQGLVYVVNSNLPIDQDQALILQLMKLP